uniref:BHLH domain-containing protein n=1 Tax=Tetranychus urticae TaxID=32264 RepID=T1KDS7_TETUR
MMKDIKPDLTSASASNYQTWTPSIAQHLITGDSTITSTSYDENCSQGIDYSYEHDSTTTTINQVRLDPSKTDSTTASEGIKKRKTGKSSYKHIPHREKPPHLVARRNARERRRVQAVNSAFATLRKHVNEPNRNKRLSKVKTLQKAIEYIAYLQGLLSEGDNLTMNVNTNVTANQHYQQSDNNNSMMQLLSPGSIVNGVNTVNNNNNNEINSGHSMESTHQMRLILIQSIVLRQRKY